MCISVFSVMRVAIHTFKKNVIYVAFSKKILLMCKSSQVADWVGSPEMH